MKRVVFICAGAIGLATALWWGVRRADAVRAEKQRTIAALEVQLAAVQSDLERQERAASVARPAALQTAPVAPVRAPAAQPQPQEVDTVAELEERLDSEPRDPAWSAAMTAEIKSAVSASAPSARVLEASCASSLCRVVLRHESADDQKAIGLTLASVGPFRNGVFYDYGTTPNSLTTRLYVIREGHSFQDEPKKAL